MKDVPFTIRRRVTWGETDPAQIVYTPRFLDYAVEAFEAWFAAIVGVDWFRLRTDYGMGSPLVHASLDFFRPLRPHQEFALTVLVEKAGRSSIPARVEGRDMDGEICFEAHLVSVLIDVATFKSHPIPPDFKSRIEAYIHACSDRGSQ